jgi:hypothetical protein
MPGASLGRAFVAKAIRTARELAETALEISQALDAQRDLVDAREELRCAATGLSSLPRAPRATLRRFRATAPPW